MANSTLKPQFIQMWAAKIQQMGLATPAILLLEVHKPLSFTAGQFLLLGQPLLNLVLPSPFTENTITLLSSRNLINALISELEKETTC